MISLFEKIDVLSIFSNHFKTLCIYNNINNSRKPNYLEIFVFYICSAFLIFLSVILYKHTLDEKIANLMFQAYAIMVGFLINALIILSDKRKDFDDSRKNAEKLTLIEETYFNTSFGVITCFMILFFCGISISDSFTFMKYVSTGCVYYLTFIFIHTLIMVIKRLERIFNF